MTLKLASTLPIWALVLLAAVIIGLTTPGRDYFIWLPIVLAASMILTFAVQLGLRRSQGFVSRLTLSTVGSLAILTVATIVLFIIR